MEEKLKQLLVANDEQNRIRAALEWKRRGKKIIGVMGDYVPEEVIFAAGMLPWRITGSWRADVSQATVYRPFNTDSYITHVAESLLAGELDFLDGMVATHLDDDQRRLWDLWIHLGKTPQFVNYLYIPRKTSELCIREFREGIARLVRKLEELAGVKVSKESLSQAIEVYNKWRIHLMELYELRKRDVPPLSGSEFLGLTTASFVMPKDEFDRELGTLLSYLKDRRASLPRVRPRLLVSSEDLDLPLYLKLIEDTGSLVAMDDLNTGSRYCWQTVDTDSEPLYALARRYLTRPTCPRMFDWDKYIDQLIQWVREFNIHGVLNFPAMYAYWREMLVPYLHDRLEEAGIPVISLHREYHLTNIGQLQTRVGAFLEVVEARL